MGTVTLGAEDTLTVIVDGVAYTPNDAALMVNPDGTWTLSVPIDQNLTEGVFDVTVLVADTAGNSTSTPNASALTVDLTAPATPLLALDLATPSDTGVSATDNQTRLTTLALNASAGTAPAGDTVTLYADGGVLITTTVAPDGSINLTIDDAVSGVTDYTYTVTDSAGNVSGVSPVLSVTVDTDIATPTITEPVALDNQVNQAESSLVAIAGTAKPDASVVLTVTDGVNTPVTVTVNSDETGQWTVAGLDVSGLADGTLTVSVNTTDVVGNQASALPVDIFLDTQLPVVPTVVTQTVNTAQPTLTGVVTISAGEIFTVSVNGVTYPASGEALSIGDGAEAGVAVNWTLTLPADITLPDATYEVIATLVDLAGNTVTDQTTSELTVDTVVPDLAVIAALVTNNTTPVLTGTVDVGAGETLRVTVNGETYTAGDDALVLNADGTWALTIPADNALPENNYTVTATVTDTAGNVSTTDLAAGLVIDISAPATPTVALALSALSDSGVSSADAVTAADPLQLSVPPGTASAGEAVQVQMQPVIPAHNHLYCLLWSTR